MEKSEITKPRIVAFEVTHQCRYQCLHCRANASAKTSEQELTTSQCKRIMAGLAQYGKCVVILTGGEPLERADIYELLQFGHGLGHRMALATCGYPINETVIERLKALNLLSLSFSLDGADPETHDTFRVMPGAFVTTLNAAKLSQQQGIRFQINTAVTRRNAGQISDIANLALSLGATCFNPFILVPMGRGKTLAHEGLAPRQYEDLLHELNELKHHVNMEIRVTCGPQFSRVMAPTTPPKKSKRHRSTGCLAGTDFAFISYRGHIQTCGFLELSAGNLLDNNYNFGVLWENSVLLKKVRDRSRFKGTCGHCQYTDQCGGCRARAYALTGDVLGEDPICIYSSQVKA